MEPDEFEALFGSANVAEEPTETDRSLNNPANILELLSSVERGIQSGENNAFGIDGFGSTENFLLGSGRTSDERTGTQNLLRATTDLLVDGDVNQGRVSRDALRGIDYVQAYDSLRGAGQITEFEARTASQIESLFSNEELGSEQAQAEIGRIRDTLSAANFRRESGITIDPNNGLETRGGEAGVSYRDSEGNYSWLATPDRTVYTIPDHLSDEAKREMMSGLPENSEFLYQGQIYTRPSASSTPTE